MAQENTGGEVLWALTDHQGSVKMLLDNEGNVVNEITYDAFGNITVESNPNVNFRFSYTGRELDPETGLYHYRTRYLDPSTGQFISPDTIGFAGGDTNLYRYVANSPVNYIDPFGLKTARSPVRNNAYRNNPFKNNPVRNRPDTGSTGGGQLSSPGYYNPGSPGSAPAIGIPSTDFVDQYRLSTEEQIRKRDYIREYGDFEGSENPELWRVDPDQLPTPYVTPTCITTPGASCDVPEEESAEDWAERMREFIEEQNRQNEERQEQQEQNDNDSPGDSCSPGDRDRHLNPEASSEPQNNNDSNQPEGSQNNDPNSNNDQNGDAGTESPQTSFQQEVSNLSETGQQNVRTLQDWARSKGWERKPGNGPEIWGVRNSDGSFSWRLKIKPQASDRPGLQAGSNRPRFDARLDDKGTYVNPFTGETGGRSTGTHIPLE